MNGIKSGESISSKPKTMWFDGGKGVSRWARICHPFSRFEKDTREGSEIYMAPYRQNYRSDNDISFASSTTRQRYILVPKRQRTS